MNLELTAAERDYLLDLLREEFGRLKAEINRTETTDFREELKQREQMLKHVLGRLETNPID